MYCVTAHAVGSDESVGYILDERSRSFTTDVESSRKNCSGIGFSRLAEEFHCFGPVCISSPVLYSKKPAGAG